MYLTLVAPVVVAALMIEMAVLLQLMAAALVRLRTFPGLHFKPIVFETGIFSPAAPERVPGQRWKPSTARRRGLLDVNAGGTLGGTPLHTEKMDASPAERSFTPSFSFDIEMISRSTEYSMD